jgi:hypothetical protein
MTEEQLADLRAEREEMAPIQKVVPEATKEGAGA